MSSVRVVFILALLVLGGCDPSGETDGVTNGLDAQARAECRRLKNGDVFDRASYDRICRDEDGNLMELPINSNDFRKVNNWIQV
jgi:hypothetical protein